MTVRLNHVGSIIITPLPPIFTGHCCARRRNRLAAPCVRLQLLCRFPQPDSALSVRSLGSPGNRSSGALIGAIEDQNEFNHTVTPAVISAKGRREKVLLPATLTRSAIRPARSFRLRMLGYRA